MAKRKKRLQKGIDSLEEQIKIHEEKRIKAIEEGKIELGDYYDQKNDVPLQLKSCGL